MNQQPTIANESFIDLPAEMMRPAYKQYFEAIINDIDTTLGSATSSLFIDGMLPMISFILQQAAHARIPIADIANGRPVQMPEHMQTIVLDHYAYLLGLQRYKATTAEMDVALKFKTPETRLLNKTFILRSSSGATYVPKSSVYAIDASVDAHSIGALSVVRYINADDAYQCTVRFVAQTPGSSSCLQPGELLFLDSYNAIQLIEAKVVSLSETGTDDETNSELARRILLCIQAPSLFGSSKAIDTYVKINIHPKLHVSAIPSGHICLYRQKNTALFHSRNRVDLYVTSGSPVTDTVGADAVVTDATNRICKIFLPNSLCAGVYGLQVIEAPSANNNANISSGAITLESALWQTLTQYGPFTIPQYEDGIVGSHLSTCELTIKDTRKDANNQFLVNMSNNAILRNVYSVKRLYQPGVAVLAQKMLLDKLHMPIACDMLILPAKPCYVTVNIVLSAQYNKNAIVSAIIRCINAIPLGIHALTRQTIIKYLKEFTDINEAHLKQLSLTGLIQTGFESGIEVIATDGDLVIPSRPELRILPETTYFAVQPSSVHIVYDE